MAGQKIDLSKIHAALDRIPAEFTGKVAKVGWFESAKYEDGTPVAYVAAIQEFGDDKSNIPPRSFMRTTFAEKSSEWVDQGVVFLRQVAKGGMTGDNALEALGWIAVGDIKEKIGSIWEPELKEITVQKRLQKLKDKTVTESLRKPLIDSGHMRDTVFVVVE